MKALLALLLVVIAAAASLQYRTNAALQREVRLLRDEVRAAVDGRRGAGERSSSGESKAAAGVEYPAAAGAGELAALREEVAALRKSTQELTQLAKTAQAANALKNMGAESALATKLVPVNQWKNAGRATPEAATETLLWAAQAGEVELVSNALTFTPAARAKADGWFAGLSESTRQQYGSPERVIALLVAKDAATLSGMQVLGQKEISADEVGVRIRFASEQGKTKDDTFLMHRTGAGWSLVLPEGAVENFARKLGGK